MRTWIPGVIVLAASAACGPGPVPPSPAPSMADAIELVAGEDYAAAEPILERLLREHLAIPSEAHHYLGVCAQAREDFAGAETHYREALRREPGLFESRANLGGVLGALGRNDEALAVLTELTQAFPEEPEGFLALAYQQDATGDVDGAVASCRLAWDLDPAGIDAPLLAAGMLAGAGRADDGIRMLEEAMGRTGGAPEAALALAAALDAAGRRDEATVVLVGATASSAVDTRALGAIALRLRDLGAMDEAIAAAREAVERTSDDAEFRRSTLTLALVARPGGRGDLAEAALRAGLVRMPGDGAMSLYLGGMLAESRRCEEAVPLLRSARDAFAAGEPGGRQVEEAVAALAACGAD